MNKADLSRFRENLLGLKQELEQAYAQGHGAEKPVELDQARIGRLSRMDALQEQEMAKATQTRRKQELQRIEAALKRIEDDEYGYCVNCGEAIAVKRLELDPAVPACIDCAG